MPCINFPIDPIGPILEVGSSSPNSLRSHGAPPPAISWFKALVDTGCSGTSIHASAARQCGIRVIGKSAIVTATGVVPVNVFYGDLHIRSLLSWQTPFQSRFDDQSFAELPHKHPSFDVLLGMDVLNLGSFSMNGGSRQATFCW